MEDGKIICSYQIGEAFESVDGKTFLSVSTDGGKTWGNAIPIVKNLENVPISENSKITHIGNNNYVCLGYAYYRENEDLPIVVTLSGIS